MTSLLLALNLIVLWAPLLNMVLQYVDFLAPLSWATRSLGEQLAETGTGGQLCCTTSYWLPWVRGSSFFSKCAYKACGEGTRRCGCLKWGDLHFREFEHTLQPISFFTLDGGLLSLNSLWTRMIAQLVNAVQPACNCTTKGRGVCFPYYVYVFRW